MASKFELNGIISVLNTPFTKEDTIDLKAVQAHVRYALQAGVVGLLVPAMASEVHKLSISERIQLVEAVMEATGSGVPVFAGAGDPDLQVSLKLIDAYKNLGCQQVLLQIPYHSDQQFRKQFTKLANRAPAVIMLQDWDPTGYGLPDQLITELFGKTESFKCLKVETVPAGVKYSRILEKTGGRLHLSGGWAVNQMIEGLRRGIHAFMPTGMHFIYTEIFNEYRAGNHMEATRLFNRILPVLSFSNQHLDISIHFFKRLLCRQGLYENASVRSPSLPFDDLHRAMADELIDKVIELEESIRHQRMIQ